MTDYMGDVRAFHEKFVIPKYGPCDEVRHLAPEEIVTRTSYIIEETLEFMRAANAGDIVATADALADLLYFTFGVATIMGLPMDDIWDVVHAANMRKTPGSSFRDKSDVLKPATWVGPEGEIKRILMRKMGLIGEDGQPVVDGLQAD